MKRSAFGRDRGLSARMFLTMFLLGALYVVFFVVLLQLFNLSYFAIIVIMGGLAFLQYFTSDKIALAASGAKVVKRDEAPELHAMVERLAAMADLPMPRVAVIPTDVPNAFATGRNPKHAVVAVTRGLWDRLEPREIEGVLAHELAHVSNRDVAVMTIASFFSMVAAILARFGLYGGMLGGGNRENNNAAPVWLILLAVSIVTYVISWVLIMTISRYREYAADRGAALLTGAPEQLMSALQKIASQMTRIPNRDLRQAAGMNAFWIFPAGVKRAGAELFMTHPPLEKRLARLAQIAGEMGSPFRSTAGGTKSRPRLVCPHGSNGRPLRAQEAQGREARPALRALVGADHARDRARAEARRRRRGLLQAAVGRRVRAGRAGDRRAPRRRPPRPRARRFGAARTASASSGSSSAIPTSRISSRP